jgi:hypothetical protein
MNSRFKQADKFPIYRKRLLVHLVLFLISILVVFFVLDERTPILLIVKSLFISLPSLFIYGAFFLINDEIKAFRQSAKPGHLAVIVAGVGIVLFCVLCMYLFFRIPFK